MESGYLMAPVHFNIHEIGVKPRWGFSVRCCFVRWLRLHWYNFVPFILPHLRKEGQGVPSRPRVVFSLR